MTPEQLQDIDRVKAHLAEVVAMKKIIDDQLDVIKETVKSAWSDMQYWNVTCKYSTYTKLKPVDMNRIMEAYPVAENLNIYNITLSKDAQHIITDESLFREEEVQVVKLNVAE